MLHIANAPGAYVYGINPAGTAIVGSYSLSTDITAAYVYQNGELTTLQFPGSHTTTAFGINAGGKVVGVFADASGAGQGFTWTPPSAPQKGQ